MLLDLTKANPIISDERVPFLTENNCQILSLPSPLSSPLTRDVIYGWPLITLTILTGKTFFFFSIQCKNGWLAASDHFHMFTQSIKFYYTFYYRYRCLKKKNVIHQIDTKNEWLLLPARFTAKFGLVFVLALENAFS